MAASGIQYLSLFVLWDYETESLWYPFEDSDGQRVLTCISGPLADKQLERYPAGLLPWNRWVQEYPETKVID